MVPSMSFPPPGPHFLPNLTTMASLMNLAPNQYHMTPMGGLMQVPIGMPGLQVPHVPSISMGITVPTGVTSISAPPMRKVTQDGSPLLGVVTNPLLFPQLTNNSSGVSQMTGMIPGSTSNQNQSNHNRNIPGNSSAGSPMNKKPSSGPSITVFVGNITERASDMLIRQLLSKCGAVNNWKRVQGANGKLQAFGFCEYGDPESAIRAIRLLHDFDVADKKLVVKADAKAKEKLEDYIKGKNPNSSESSSIFHGSDPESEREDSDLLSQLHAILKEHEVELSRDPDPNKVQSRRYDKRSGESAKPENLADMDMEEEKRSLIHREIDKFRDTYKNDESEKKSSETSRARDSKPSPDSKRDNERDLASDDRHFRDQSMEYEYTNKRRDKVRGRTPTVNKDRSSVSYTSKKDMMMARERSDRLNRNERPDRIERGERIDRISRMDQMERMERDRIEDRNSIHSDRTLDDDDEMQEKRRMERRLREKEASYQKRLRNWEARESRKSKEYKKYEMKQDMRKEEEVKEIRKLKQFLEDYDDDRDDLKYYKGSALARRLREREKEKEDDARDKRQEKRELEELKRKLVDEGHPDPDKEAQKRLNSCDSNKERDKIVCAKIRELMNEARSKSKKIEEESSLPCLTESNARNEMHVKSFTFTGIKVGGTKGQSATSESPAESNNSFGEKRKKLTIQDVFNSNEDDENLESTKRRKLPPLNDDNTDSNHSLLSNTTKGGSISVSEGQLKANLTSEEKKKQVKSLIERIPTTKEELFKYKIDWNLVDSTLMEKRIRPWVNKKITEYIGEEEQALLDFICSKLQAKSSAQSILDDVAMVLDDEAEVFVVKMWRLIIYEIEAKKLGIGK